MTRRSVLAVLAVLVLATTPTALGRPPAAPPAYARRTTRLRELPGDVLMSTDTDYEKHLDEQQNGHGRDALADPNAIPHVYAPGEARVAPYTPAVEDPDAQAAAERAEHEARERATEAMVLDRFMGLLGLAIDGCGTTTRSDVDLARVLQTARDAMGVVTKRLDDEHLSITAAAQRLSDGEPLL